MITKQITHEAALNTWRDARDALEAARAEEKAQQERIAAAPAPREKYDTSNNWGKLHEHERELAALLAARPVWSARADESIAKVVAVNALDVRDASNVATHRGLRDALKPLEARKAELEREIARLDLEASSLLAKSAAAFPALVAARKAADEPEPPQVAAQGHDLTTIVANVDRAIAALAPGAARRPNNPDWAKVSELTAMTSSLRARLEREKADREEGERQHAWEKEQRVKREADEAAAWREKCAAENREKEAARAAVARRFGA